MVGGSDHGIVYVFDRRSGENLDEIPHANGGIVQTISVCLPFALPRKLLTNVQAQDASQGTFICAATSTDRGRISISVWIRKTE